jgi:hypothetical protein
VGAEGNSLTASVDQATNLLQNHPDRVKSHCAVPFLQRAFSNFVDCKVFFTDVAMGIPLSVLGLINLNAGRPSSGHLDFAPLFDSGGVNDQSAFNLVLCLFLDFPHWWI